MNRSVSKWHWYSALVLCAGLVFPTLAAGAEDQDAPLSDDIERYNRVGVELNDQLSALSLSFKEGNVAAFRTVVDKENPPKIEVGHLGNDVSVGGARHKSLESVGTDVSVLDFFADWRKQFVEVKKAKFKVADIDKLLKNNRVNIQVRYEVIGTTKSGSETHRGRFMTLFELSKKGVRLEEISLMEAEVVAGAAADFVEESVARGIDVTNIEDPRFMPPSKTLRFQLIRHAIGGASVFDLDGDGDDDIAHIGAYGVRVFENDGSANFVEVTDKVGLAGIPSSNVGLFADLDGDGDVDFFLGRFIGENRVYENDAGIFRVRERTGMQDDPMTSGASITDFDGDGRLDIYVTRFLDATKDIPDLVHWARNGLPNRLYLNRGNWVFEEVAEKRGAADTGLGLGVVSGDFDQDGDQDMYLANDFGRNVFLQNQGGGHFKDVAKENGTLAVSGGMATDAADVDGDGDLDLYVSSIRSNQRWFSIGKNYRSYVLGSLKAMRRKRLPEVLRDLRKYQGDDWDNVGQLMLGGNYLLENQGDGFVDVSSAKNAAPYGFFWGSGFLDIDNDGRLDLYAANGWISGKKTHDL